MAARTNARDRAKHRRRRYTGSTTPAFAENTVSGLKGWYKADSLALNDGDAVATWADQSLSGADLTEGTNRPVYKASIKNGRPVVRFDGTNDRLSTTDGDLLAVRQGDDLAMTIFVVAAPDDSVAASMCICAFSLSSNASRPYAGPFYLSHVGQKNLRWGQDGNTASDGTVDADLLSSPANTFYVWAFKHSGTAITAYQNGSIVGGLSATASNSTTMSTLNTFAVGVLDRSTDGSFFKGDIGEIMVYSGALSDADRGLVQTYLSAKWGI